MSCDNAWAGEFGRSYVDRNDMTPDELDKLYRKNVGISRSDLNDEFLSGLSRSSTILEVGCNRGLQLELLSNKGYNYLYGFDVSSYALNLLLSRLRQVNIIRSTALNFPFRNESFDIVFSSGVLIHIPPKELSLAVDEIYRCSKHYIWCLEYFAEEKIEVEYRGKMGLLWKNNFLKIFTKRFPDLSVIRTRKLKYADNQNVDIMFLLEKQSNPSNS